MGSSTYNVLVVEDEPMILNNIVKKLDQSNMGFTVVQTAKNGRQALDQLGVGLPDVVFTDIRMPLLDGMQLVQQIDAYYSTVRTVILSGYNDFEYARTAIRYNVRNYLSKPLDMQALHQCLMRLRIELDAEHDSVLERMKVLKATQGVSVQDSIEMLRLFLNENYMHDFRLDQIAQELNFNSSYLSKWFVKIVGETPSNYIIHLKISKAKKLLQSVQELSVKQVGEMVGYADQNYFSRLFKQQTGLSPSQYREMCLRGENKHITLHDHMHSE